EDGAYTVTVEIAGNDNYEAVTLSLGAFAIYRPPVPEIRRTVTLAPSPYYDISPAPGVYRIASGRDMVLTLTPLATLPAGHVPQVTTGRRILADDEGGITVESNADGTYTVHIHRIQETTAVTVTATAVSSGVTSSGSLPAARVWSYGKQLFITAAVSGRAQVYNAGDRLVKLLSTVAGETVTQSLPPGIYLIAIEGKSYRVVITE
ncbi:MAG: hypothetical protein LBP50_06025, partial [Tannerella sp.]|nr:hypothetical protein [Tannerella sp.]